MASACEHYENHLADYYAWISGGVNVKIKENHKFFSDHNIEPIGSGLAFDLGAGCGFQSVPLARLGFRVAAVDLSAKLLAQLRANAKDLQIETICDDLLNFTDYDRGRIELVVCMGDTLTHLESSENVQALFDRAYSAVEPAGRLVLSFRNLTVELGDLDRFIPVKSDDHTIFTCFLEYEKDTVKVHDIIYEKKNGQWALRKSFFRKLRISPDWVGNYLGSIGFSLEFEKEENGMVTIIARKA